MNKDTDKNPQDAIEDMLQENQDSSYDQLTSGEALSLMEQENSKVAEKETQYQTPSKKQVNRILTVIEKTELLMGEFFNKLAQVDAKFNAVSQVFFNKADEIAASIKNPSEEEQKLILINVAAGVAVKGMGALWQSFQTERQLRGILHTYADEAEEKLPYIGMLIDWLESAGDIAFERLLDTEDIDAMETNLELYRGLDYTFKLACYLYSVYDSSLRGEFTQLPYPTMFDVNRSLISNLAHIETKATEAEQIDANRAALGNVAERIKSVMTEETELPELIDVLIASDDQLMSTAINMCMPNPDSFEDEEEGFETSSHFPFENLTMIPESIGFVADFSNLKGCGDSHGIALKIEKNTSLSNVADYVDVFKQNQSQHDSREKLYGINSWLLAGVTFLLFWKIWDWAWYWSLLMGFIMFIIGVKFSPFSKIRQICRNKAILLERELIKFTKENGGYTEVIDFHQLRRKNNNVFIGAVIGAIIGCFGGPFGFIGGVLVGSLIGWFVKSYKDEEEDWREISIGSGWKAKLCCAILSISLLYLIVTAFFGGFSFLKSKDSGKNNHIPEAVEVASSSSDIEEAVEVVEETSPEMEAVKDLYRIFYYKDDAIYGSNSKHMKERFEEYGVSSTIQNPYTPSLQAEIDRMEALTQEVGDLSFGFDSDILHFGQGDIADLNLGVYDVTKIDENTYSIRTLYHNMEDYERTFIMKKVDGTYRIDDMDNIRAFIKEESAKAMEYLKERGNVEVADNGNFKFSGKIGKSPIVVQLAIDGEKVTGKYAYQSTLKKYGDGPGSYFYLSGNVDETGTMNLVSKMHKSNDIFEYITLPSKAFNTGSVISGELKNANNGDSFPIELHME